MLLKVFLLILIEEYDDDIEWEKGELLKKEKSMRKKKKKNYFMVLLMSCLSINDEYDEFYIKDDL
jgi:hypothetical protein